MAWTLPTPYVLQQIRRLRGGAKVTYPECDTKGKRVERVLICPLSEVPLAYGTADVDFTDCKLVYQEMLGQDFQNAEVYRRYENGYTDATEISELVGETTHEWGVAQTKQQRVPYGTAASYGYTVWQSTVQPESKTRALKTTLEFPAGTTYPTFRDWEYDHNLGLSVPLDKTIVAPGTSPPSGGEIRQIDPWRSIQITPRIDLMNLPTAQSWKIATRDSFPAETTDVTVEAVGIPDVVITGMYCNVVTVSAYSGSVAGSITRSFSYGPPSNLETPALFFPQSHHQTLAADVQHKIEGKINIKDLLLTVSIPESLHPTFSLNYSVKGFIIHYGYIHATSPATLSHGDQILRAINSSPWRFGIWVTEKQYVTIP